MEINYNNLTENQLEEWVEFIDWSLVPSSLITDNIKEKFANYIPELKGRIFLENLLRQAKAENHRVENNTIYFIHENKAFMTMDFNNNMLWLAKEIVVTIFKHSKQEFIINIINQFLKDFKIPESEKDWLDKEKISNVIFRNLGVLKKIDFNCFQIAMPDPDQDWTHWKVFELGSVNYYFL